MVNYSKLALVLALFASFFLFGCLEQIPFLKPESKALYLGLIDKANSLANYEAIFEMKMSLSSYTYHISSHEWKKGENYRITMSTDSEYGATTSSVFELDGKKYVCENSSYYLNTPTVVCKESVSSNDTTAVGDYSFLDNLEFDADTFNELVEQGVLQFPSTYTESEVAGRSCYLFKNINFSFSKLLYVTSKSEKLESLSLLANDTGMTEMTLTMCLDKETGISLSSMIESQLSSSLYSSKLVIISEMKEFYPNKEISDSVFVLPAPVMKDCYSLVSYSDFDTYYDRLYECYYDAVDGNASLCNNYGNYYTMINCIKGVYNYTQDRDICDVIIDSNYRDDCYEDIARVADDESLCDKISTNYSRESCHDKFDSSSYGSSYDYYSGYYGGIEAVTSVNGMETITKYPLQWDSDYQTYKIVATATSVQFYVDDVLIATHTTNIPQGSLNLYFGTSYDGYGNIPIYVEQVTAGNFSEEFSSSLSGWYNYTSGMGEVSYDKVSGTVSLQSGYGGAGTAKIWSKQSFALSSTPLIFEANLSAYQESYGTVYGDGQPRGFRIGTDDKNVIEFRSYTDEPSVNSD